MKNAHLFLVALLAGAAVSPSASAGESESAESSLARGRELFDNGATLYEEGSYQAAIAAFEEALRLTGEKSLYYNIANCYERLAQWQDAYDALNMYRAFAPASERDTLERRLRSVDDRLREEARRTPSNPVPTQDTTATPQPVVTTAAAPPASLPSTPARRRGAGNWAMVGTGAGLAVLGGVGAGVSFAGSRSAIEADDQAAYAMNRGLNTASLALTGVGAVVAIVGVAVPLTRTGLHLGVGAHHGATSITLNGHW